MSISACCCAPDDALQAASASPASRRASWVGTINLGSIALPVKTYSGVDSEARLSMHLVHTECGQRIKTPRICAEHGEVASTEISRSIVTPDGEELMLSNDEFVQLRPPTVKQIDLARFICLNCSRYQYYTQCCNRPQVRHRLSGQVEYGIGRLAGHRRWVWSLPESRSIELNSHAWRIAVHFSMRSGAKLQNTMTINGRSGTHIPKLSRTTHYMRSIMRLHWRVTIRTRQWPMLGELEFNGFVLVEVK